MMAKVTGTLGGTGEVRASAPSFLHPSLNWQSLEAHSVQKKNVRGRAWSRLENAWMYASEDSFIIRDHLINALERRWRWVLSCYDWAGGYCWCLKEAQHSPWLQEPSPEWESCVLIAAPNFHSKMLLKFFPWARQCLPLHPRSQRQTEIHIHQHWLWRTIGFIRLTFREMNRGHDSEHACHWSSHTARSVPSIDDGSLAGHVHGALSQVLCDLTLLVSIWGYLEWGKNCMQLVGRNGWVMKRQCSRDPSHPSVCEGPSTVNKPSCGIFFKEAQPNSWRWWQFGLEDSPVP